LWLLGFCTNRRNFLRGQSGVQVAQESVDEAVRDAITDELDALEEVKGGRKTATSVTVGVWRA
jgi:hypothetical protein